jgi:thymidylate synthase (FAD)
MQNENPWFIEGSSKSRLVVHTPSPEDIMGYVARVTSKDQSNPNVEKLLRYCVKQKHWSVFETASMTVEVITPLAIAVQLLRHASFKFQQFSGRYEDQTEMRKHTQDLSAYNDLFYMPEEAREQDRKNRQNSILAADPTLTDKMWDIMSTSYKVSQQCYNELIEVGLAKEMARFVLPQGVYSRLYVTGSCRSWIHYLAVRDDEGVAQYEHVELARSLRPIFNNVFPAVSEAIKVKQDPSLLSLEKENADLKSRIAVLEATLRGTL